MKNLALTFLIAGIVAMTTFADDAWQGANTMVQDLEKGKLYISSLTHASVLLQYNGKAIYIDPTNGPDYDNMPKADIILITHQHSDHLQASFIGKLEKEGTVIIVPEVCAKTLPKAMVMNNGDEQTFAGIPIKAVPAYNIVHKRNNGEHFHPEGMGNGYIFSFDGYNVYVAGDTENIPEMKSFGPVDVAFLPMNLPYTMSVEECANAAGMINPSILYIYHYNGQDPEKLKELLKDGNIEVRYYNLY